MTQATDDALTILCARLDRLIAKEQMRTKARQPALDNARRWRFIVGLYQLMELNPDISRVKHYVRAGLIDVQPFDLYGFVPLVALVGHDVVYRLFTSGGSKFLTRVQVHRLYGKVIREIVLEGVA